MANISGASLEPIYGRLNSMAGYHPFDAETFSDWSMEAGDIVTVSRGSEEYQSPVHTARMVWKGTPQISVSATGKKERDAVSRVSRHKYGRGTGAMRNQQGFRYDFYSEDGFLFSSIEASASQIRTEVGYALSGIGQSVIEQTATYIRTEVSRAASSISQTVIEQTAEYIRQEITAVASGVAWSVIEQTVTNIIQEVGRKNRTYVQWSDPNNGVNQLIKGDVWVRTKDKRTWNALRTMSWDEAAESKWRDFYGVQQYVWDGEKWVLVTNGDAIVESRVKVEQDDEHWAVLAEAMDAFGEAYQSNLQVTAQKINADVSTAKSTIYASISETASNIRMEVANTERGLKSEIEQTAESITSTVADTKNELGSLIRQTATNIYSKVWDDVADTYSTIEQTATSISAAVVGAKSELGSLVEMTSTQIYSKVWDATKSTYSTITQTAESIELAVTGAKSDIGSVIRQTSTSIFSAVWNKAASTYSTIEQTATSITTAVTAAKSDIGSVIRQTSTSIFSAVWNKTASTYSTIEQTAESIATAVTTAKSDIGSVILQTSTSIFSAVWNKTASTYSTIEQTATSITTAVTAAKSDIGSVIRQTSTSIYSAVWDQTASTYSTIEQTAESIATAVTNAKSDIGSVILQTSTSIYSAVWDQTASTYSTIEQTATALALKVGKGDVISSINLTEEEATISADRINLEGYVTATQLDADWLAAKLATVANATMGNLSVNDVHSAAIYVANGTTPGSGAVNYANIKDYMMSLQITGPTNGKYKLQKKSLRDSDWVDVGSFERATLLSGAWSGDGHLQVTASTSGVSEANYYLWDSGLKKNADGTAYTTGNVWYVPIHYKTNLEIQSSTATGKSIMVNATPRYNAGWYDFYHSGEKWDGCWTGDGTHGSVAGQHYVCGPADTPDGGWETYYNIETIANQAGLIVSSLIGSWSSGIYTVTPNGKNSPSRSIGFSSDANVHIAVQRNGTPWNSSNGWVRAPLKIVQDPATDHEVTVHTFEIEINGSNAYPSSYNMRCTANTYNRDTQQWEATLLYTSGNSTFTIGSNYTFRR